MIKDGLPVEASQEGQSRPVSLAGLVLVLCVALMGVRASRSRCLFCLSWEPFFIRTPQGWRF